MAWTDERTEQLKNLWASGMTASRIADELRGVTRNAVIAKVHRMGFQELGGKRTKHGGDNGVAPRPKAQRQPRTMRHAMPTGRNGGYRSGGPDALPADESLTGLAEADAAHTAATPPAERTTLLELSEATCRWPIGDPLAPDFFFCGAQVRAAPYCAYHARVAYTGVPKVVRAPFIPNRRSNG